MASNFTWQLPEVPDYYTNAIRLAFSPYDFFFEIGLTLPSEVPQETPAIKPIARIRMSPQQAFVLSKVLESQLGSFEKLNGAINLPPDALQFLDSAQ